MGQVIENIVDGIASRITGPMHFRFIFQPLMAIILGIRDGIQDAKANEPPFISDLFFKPENRKRRIKDALKALLKPIIVAIILDAIAQYLLFKHIRPLPAVIVGTFVMGVPYSIARGISNRIMTMRIKKEKRT